MENYHSLTAVFVVSCIFWVSACKDGDKDDCDVGAEGCDCTVGGACNDGLDCFSGLCVDASGDTDNNTDIDAYIYTDSDSNVDTDSKSDTEPSVVNCSEVAQEAADNAIKTILITPANNSCGETGEVRPLSSECVAFTSEQTLALEALGLCSLYVLRSDASWDQFYTAAVAAAGDFYCSDHVCSWAGGIDCPAGGYGGSQPWCDEGSCRIRESCQCGTGEYYGYELVCDGTADCPDGSDEVGCK